ncbi:hypothetical protein [Nonlabens antarcticus]|uniref:hypothetical protein n=1 Tax=Nonlabens antarcticus TaxID=392714 RepID=UPI001890D7A9|nr:hypothetical protein [Nonlabens antarcticus]
MDTGMIAITVTLIAIVSTPFILMLTGSSKRKSQLIKGLETLASQKNGTLSKKEIFLNFALGLDENAQQIYFFRKTDASEVAKTVDLHTVKSCSISKQSTMVKMEKGMNESIEKVSLLFEFKNNESPERFVLFNEEESLQLNGEIGIAQEWKTFVTSLLLDEKKEAPVLRARPNKTLDLSKIAAM